MDELIENMDSDWSTGAQQAARPVVFRGHPWHPRRHECEKARASSDTSVVQNESDRIRAGAADVSDVINSIYDRANKTYGTDLKPRQ